MEEKCKRGATAYALIWVGQRGDLPEVCFSFSFLSAISRYRLHGVIFCVLLIFFICSFSAQASSKGNGIGVFWEWFSVCFGGLSFGSTPKLGFMCCVPIIYKKFLWHSNGGTTAPPGAHSDYNFLPQFSRYL